MKPTHYNIRITPDFSDFTFDGVTSLDIQSNRSVNEVTLNACDLKFHSCVLHQASTARDCAFDLLPDSQEVMIHLPEMITGDFALTIRYSGVISDQYAGLYRSKYHHDGQEKVMASTQFEASDARRAFPCFDRPDMKATFDIELVIDDELTAISNAALLEEKNLANGKKVVRFERTPRMSTYLVFFGVGEFEFLEDASAQPLVRVAVAPGKKEFGRYALDIARKSLAFGESYLDIPYPLSKCDYIAMPDSMGAMENFGAIRHAEDVLLVYPGVTSKARQALITKIIAHEGIHMWFGDLVSPAAWKYLWLNEAFATYFTYVIPHHYYPEWGVWEQFFHERLLSGLERDALAGSVPIDLPHVDDPNADPSPTPSTAPIVYNKGAAVIRMLAAYLGEADFRQALHDFLDKYQFESVSSEQFWATVELSSGVPLKDFARTWIIQSGHPLVSVERTDAVLHISQRRFGYDENVANGVWVIPLDLSLFLEDGTVESRQIVFETDSLTVEIPENTRAYKLNAGFTGFYRVQYPGGDWRKLGEMIRSQVLSSVDSLNVLDDLFALVKAGQHSVQTYLQFVEDYCKEEDRYLPLTNLARNLERLYQVCPTQRQRISALGLSLFEGALDRMNWEPREDESMVTTELRETLLWTSFLLESTRAADFSRSQFQRYLQGQPPHRDIIATVLKIGAALDAEASPYLWSIASDPERAEAERIMALEALGNHPDQEQLTELLEKNLAEIPSSLRSYMIQACARSKQGVGFLWDWFRVNLPRLETWPLTVVERLIVGIVPLSGLGKTDEVGEVLGAFVDRHPNTAASMSMALELLAVNQNLRDS